MAGPHDSRTHDLTSASIHFRRRRHHRGSGVTAFSHVGQSGVGAIVGTGIRLFPVLFVLLRSPVGQARSEPDLSDQSVGGRLRVSCDAPSHRLATRSIGFFGLTGPGTFVRRAIHRGDLVFD